MLVDGGLVNNLPVDVVKDMGADVVIAVDVGEPPKERKELRSALAVLEQSISILRVPRWRENVKQADLLIRPEVADFGVTDFDKDRIKRILQRGEEAASRSVLALKELVHREAPSAGGISDSAGEGSEGTRLQAVFISGQISVPYPDLCRQLGLEKGDVVDAEQIRGRLAALEASGQFEDVYWEWIPQGDDRARLRIRLKEKRKPIIHGISIVGNEVLPFSFIYRLLGLKPSDRLDIDDLHRQIMSMYGLGYFERIDYEVEPIGENQVKLLLKIKELPLRKLRVGLRYDDLHKLVAAVAVQVSNLPLAGLRVESELQFAGLTRFKYRASYPSRALNLPVYPFVHLSYKDVPANIFDVRGQKIARYNDRSTTVAVGLGLLPSRWLNAEVAYRHEYMNIEPSIAFTDPMLFPTWKDQLRQIHASANIDLLDDVLLPRKGLLIEARYEGSFRKLKSEVGYFLASVSADVYTTFRRRHTTRLHGFWATGSRQLPLYKFHNHGRPHLFVGTSYDQLFGRKMSVLRFDYRYQYKRDIFVKAIANVVFDFEYGSPTATVRSHSLWGWGVGLLFLSPVGPIEIVFSRGDQALVPPRSREDEVYVSLGYKF